ncbi:hypothetical protein JXO52_13325 [bacterium]|nr:hypothetical protein [bacterium]
MALISGCIGTLGDLGGDAGTAIDPVRLQQQRTTVLQHQDRERSTGAAAILDSLNALHPDT